VAFGQEPPSRQHRETAGQKMTRSILNVKSWKVGTSLGP
jgi:hypothetical protein